ncbi:hypothetical protein [Flavobacterium macacae]|uniref:Uncharacterized protein n=1 Tax=Flavobacterium macacae TaxID=2488993 RepID=A0A3P3W722_9FLAO|nr:hypothetical protein [Flavobacterium macacae]RRJ90760.1 hypothetical protein EG849_09795 [Flavobacterium macacae]
MKHIFLCIGIFGAAMLAASHPGNSQSDQPPLVQGWISLPNGLCIASISCASTGSVFCTAPTGGHRLYGKDQAGTCTIPLYRP